jgi:hypothetical protein
MIWPQIWFNPRAWLPQVPQWQWAKPTAKTGMKQPIVSPNMTPMDAAPMTPMSPVDQRLAGLQDRMSMMPRTQMPQADTSAFSIDQIFRKGQNMMKPQIWADFGTGLPSAEQVRQTPQEAFMPQATPETPVQAPTASVATDTAVADLVADIKNVVAEGREVEISRLKELYPEYANLWDAVLQDLVIDLQNVVREGREVTPERVLELYPELAGQQAWVKQDTSSIFKSMPWDTLPYADPLKPYTWEEWVWQYIWETAMNIPSSARNVIAGLWNMITSPIQTIKWIWKGISWAGANVGIAWLSAITGKSKEQIKSEIFSEWNQLYEFIRDKIWIDLSENEQVADAIWWFMVDRYGGSEEIKKTIKEDPVGIFWDIVSLFQWWTTMAGRAWIINKSQQASIMAKLNAIDPYIQIPAQATKGAWKMIWLTRSWLSNLAEMTMNKITSIDKEDRVFARKNPQIVNSFIDWTKTVEDVAWQIQSKFEEMSDTRKVMWKEYEDIRKMWNTADVTKIIDEIAPWLWEKWINIWTDGNITFDKFSKFNEKQQKAISQARKIVQDVAGEWSIAADDILNLRQKLDDLINWEWKPLKASTVDKEAANVIQSFRRAIDNKAKTIPWLAELDKKFWPVINDINTFRKDWFNSDWTLKDNALSKIKNLTNDANKSRLERLERIMPWITNEVRWLKVWIAVDTAMKSNVWQYVQQMLLWWWLVSTLTNPTLVVPLITAWVVLTPKNIIKIIQTIWAAEEWIGNIVDKIKKWLKLSDWEESKLAKIIEQNPDEIQRIAPTLPDKPKNVPTNPTTNVADSNMPRQRSLDTTKIDDIVPPARTSNMDITQPSAMVKAPDDVVLYRAWDLSDPRKTWIFLSNNRDIAKNYETTWLWWKKTKEYILKPWLKIKETETRYSLIRELDPKFKRNDVYYKIVKKYQKEWWNAEQARTAYLERKIRLLLQKKGYDWVKYSWGTFSDQAWEYQIFNAKNIITKIDGWASKTSNLGIRQPSAMLKAPDDLMSEARKYKSADEFNNALLNNRYTVDDTSVVFHWSPNANNIIKDNKFIPSKDWMMWWWVYFWREWWDVKAYLRQSHSWVKSKTNQQLIISDIDWLNIKKLNISQQEYYDFLKKNYWDSWVKWWEMFAKDMKKQWYDWAELSSRWYVVIWDAKKVNPIDLKQIREQANK